MAAYDKDKRRVVVSAKLDVATRDHFRDLCRDLDTSPSALIAELIAGALVSAGRIAKKLSGKSEK